MSVPKGVPALSHILFADDILLFLRGNKRTLRAILRFMIEYGLNSGQYVNRSKSSVYLGKFASPRRTFRTLGVNAGSLPFIYLGVPIFQGRPKRSYFQSIADKVKCKLSAWKGSLLSQAGRVQLISSVIQSLLIHSFQVYAWPVSLLTQVQSWVRNFLWSGDPQKRGVPLVSWIKCCRPKNCGGLGMRNLFTLNRSLLLKRCWEVVSSNSPASKFLYARFLPKGISTAGYYKKSSI
jgi:hypothetical protein